MAKKIVKKRKWKIKSILISFVIIAGVLFGVWLLSLIPVKLLVVKNNHYLTDDYVLSLGKVMDYPKFLFTSRDRVEKRLEESVYIHKAQLIKKHPFTFVLDIEEEKPIFFDNNLNKYVFQSGNSVEEDEISREFRVPRIINYIPDVKYKKFIEGMGKVNEDVLCKIGDIEYKPNEYDKDRFLLYMDDGNMVYLTLTKFKMINHYNDVLEQLDNHKGILYLDNGNHFQIKE